MTHPLIVVVLAAALTGCAGNAVNVAPADVAVTSVTHLDVAKSGLDNALVYLRDYIAASQTQPGALRIEAFRQVTGPNHFTLVEVWGDDAAYAAHLASPQARLFHAKLDPLLGSPHDERLFERVAGNDGQAGGAASSNGEPPASGKE